jgi:ketosteroid isomerase-like protein
MSQENVEFVRRALAVFNSGTTGPALDAIMDPEIEFVTSGVNAGQTIYHGLAGVRELQTHLREVFDEITIEPDEFRATGDAVVVLGRLCVRGRNSGAAVESRRAWVVTVREKKIVRQQTYDDQKEALEAVGLTE